MTPTAFWYRAKTGRLPATGDAACWLCGAGCPADSAPVDAAIRVTFTNHDRAAARESTVVCEACAAYLDHKWMRSGQKRAMGLYTKSLLVWPDRWGEWERERMADDLLAWHADGLSSASIAALNYSKQKHVIPWARINSAGNRRPWISTDEGAVRLSDDFPALLAALAGLWARGYPKVLLVRGELASNVLARAANPVLDMDAMRALAPHVESPLLDLVSYVLTEDNRDRLAGFPPAVLGSAQSTSAEGRRAGRTAQRSGRPGVQAPVRTPMVGHAGGASQTVRHDFGRPRPLDQLARRQAGRRGRSQPETP